jgi:hypothetical protein
MCTKGRGRDAGSLLTKRLSFLYAKRPYTPHCEEALFWQQPFVVAIERWHAMNADLLLAGNKMLQVSLDSRWQECNN